MNRILHPRSLGAKLFLASVTTAFTIFIVNVFLFYQINKVMERVEKVYVSNVQIIQLSDTLLEVQNAMTEYLSTKNSDSLEHYYSSSSDYLNLLSSLDKTAIDTSAVLTLENIKNISATYLSETENALQAKRGRNISRYKNKYNNASRLYSYLNAYITSLNATQFKNNNATYQSMRQSFQVLETTSMLVLFLVSVGNLLIALIATRRTMRPLRELVDYASEVGNGNFDLEPMDIPNPNDEVGILSTAFFEMVHRIQGYISELKASMEHESQMKENELKMNAHLKEAELKYLQAQINPHFLFNTLNAAVQLSMMESADRTYQYLQNVAAFFRAKTNREMQITTLQDEIELVDHYMYIMDVRFSGDIQYEKEIDASLIHITIPSMILQPLMENAINHGVRDISWEAKIKLSIYALGNQIVISVKDNGKGMSEEKILELLKGEQTERQKGDETNGVGLWNVIHRMQLFYGKEDVFDIISAGQNQGTEILFYLPKP